MTVQELHEAVRSMVDLASLKVPTVEGGLGLSNREIDRALSTRTTAALVEVATAHPWPFTTREGSFTTVADVSDYELRGNSSDCMSVYAIYYKTLADALDQMHREAIDNLQRFQTIRECQLWMPIERDNAQFPKVRLYGTPSEAVTMPYVYWRNDVSIGEFGAEFQDLLILALAKRLNTRLKRQYVDELAKVIGRHGRARKGPHRVRQDPAIVRANYNISRMYGDKF
jgi:hypothetical protein